MLDLLTNAGVSLANLRYNYSEIAAEHRETVREAAIDIRQRGQRATSDMIAIGHKLTNVKSLLPHGQFVSWLETEFSLSLRTAQNFMAVASKFGDQNATVAFLSDSVLYMLSGPRVPEEAVGAVIAEAEATGKSPTKKRTREILDQYIPRIGPAAPDDVDEELGPHLYQSVKFTTLEPQPCTIIYDGKKPADGQFVVYGLFDPRDNSLYYIGSTERFDVRMREHATANASQPVRIYERKAEIFAAGLHTVVRILAQSADRELGKQLETLMIQQAEGTLNTQRGVPDRNRELTIDEAVVVVWRAMRKGDNRKAWQMLDWLSSATSETYQAILNPGVVLPDAILAEAVGRVRVDVQAMAEREARGNPAEPTGRPTRAATTSAAIIAPPQPATPQIEAVASAEDDAGEDDADGETADRRNMVGSMITIYRRVINTLPDYEAVTGCYSHAGQLRRALETAIKDLEGNLV